MLFDTLSIDFENAERLRLIDRGLIKVIGPAAEKFLQGLVTCDVRTIKTETSSDVTKLSCLGAHCNAKGRILFTFRLFYSEESYFLSLPKNQVAFAIEALKKYAVFSKVSIDDMSEAVSQDTLIAGDRMPHLIDFEQWKLRDIEAGIAEIYPETREQFTPHELNYHQLGGVSFDKGCYIGQEIVARMHYLGKLKTELVLADFSAGTPPVRGEKIFYAAENQSPQLGGYLVDFALVKQTQYKLLVSLYATAQSEALWIGDDVKHYLLLHKG